jgi:anti-sigma B factor antagonist
MKFRTAQQGTATVIQLQGSLMGGPDASSLNTKLHELVESGKNNVVIDLADVKFINSSGLGLLIGGVTTLKNAGGSLKLANASQKIVALIKITKLSSVFEIYDSVQKAAESFSK